MEDTAQCRHRGRQPWGPIATRTRIDEIVIKLNELEGEDSRVLELIELKLIGKIKGVWDDMEIAGIDNPRVCDFDDQFKELESTVDYLFKFYGECNRNGTAGD